MVGIIPAAGKATRMGGALPKALIEIEGQTLLERSIETLKAIGVAKVVVVVGHLGERIVEFLASRDFGVEVSTAQQEQPLGLAHAIATAANQIDNDFVVLCPDNIYTDPEDLSELARYSSLANPLSSCSRQSRQTNSAIESHMSFPLIAISTTISTSIEAYTDNTSGLGINSTGCVFFRRDALAFLPSFAELNRGTHFSRLSRRHQRQ